MGGTSSRFAATTGPAKQQQKDTKAALGKAAQPDGSVQFALGLFAFVLQELRIDRAVKRRGEESRSVRSTERILAGIDFMGHRSHPAITRIYTLTHIHPYILPPSFTSRTHSAFSRSTEYRMEDTLSSA